MPRLSNWRNWHSRRARNMRFRKIQAFTLIEVLVALAIVAIALAAAGRAAQVAVDTAQESKLRTLATWVAQNRIAERDMSRVFPATGTTSGSSRMAGIDFSWTETVSETPNVAFRKVSVQVQRPQDVQTLVTLNAYLVRAGTGTSP